MIETSSFPGKVTLGLAWSCSGIMMSLLAIILTNTARGADAPFPDSYNVVWNSPSADASGSMPVNGGSIACNVWVEGGDLLFYIGRSGAYDEHGALLKLGRVRVKLDPNPFLDADAFRQELRLHDGYLVIEGEKGRGEATLHAKIKVWVEVHRPVIHVDVDADYPIGVEAAYESWRMEDRELAPGRSYGERFAMFNLVGYPGKIVRTADTVAFGEGGVLFFHRNPDKKITPEVLIEQQGLESEVDHIVDDLKHRTSGGILLGEGFKPSGEGRGEYWKVPFTSFKLRGEKAVEHHRLLVATHIEQTEKLSGWKRELLEAARESSEDHDEAFARTVSWWHAFWDRSRIVIDTACDDPEDPGWQAARNYQLFRYQLGGNVFGEYPTKFNGGNLTFDPVLVEKGSDYGPDWRKWGGNVFTAQNQRLLYWPLLKSGDFDAILPQFELYRKGLPGAVARVKAHFKHDGALYCEYTSVPGLAMGDGWGWKGGASSRQRGEEIPFGDPRADGLKGYGDVVEKGVMANPAIAYHWESQVEHAYMILEYHRFSGADITRYMPFIEQSLIFFDEHYRLRRKMRDGKELDQQGKLVFFPSTSCESYRGAKNPSDLLSGIHACLEAMLKLDDRYLAYRSKAYYRDYLARLPDLSRGEVEGDRILKPAESWGRYQNVECPQFYPLFPFNRFRLGKDDMTLFRNTWKHGRFPKNMVISWHQDGIFFARMGMTEEAADYNARKLKNSVRRFPTFWGPGHDWVPDHNRGGSGMIGLQEMLMQTVDDRILLFPAWPAAWDVEFKLHAPGRTVVTGRLVEGEVQALKVTPGRRREDVIMMNGYRWPGE